MKDYKLQDLLTIFVLNDHINREDVVAFFRNASTQDLIFVDSKEEAISVASAINTPTIVIADFSVLEPGQ